LLRLKLSSYKIYSLKLINDSLSKDLQCGLGQRLILIKKTNSKLSLSKILIKLHRALNKVQLPSENTNKLSQGESSRNQHKILTFGNVHKIINPESIRAKETQHSRRHKQVSKSVIEVNRERKRLYFLS